MTCDILINTINFGDRIDGLHIEGKTKVKSFAIKIDGVWFSGCIRDNLLMIHTDYKLESEVYKENWNNLFHYWCNVMSGVTGDDIKFDGIAYIRRY